MHKYTARSDYKKISRDADRLKEKRVRNKRQDQAKALLADRAKTLNLKKLWPAADEKRAASIRDEVDESKTVPLTSVAAAREALDGRRKARHVSAKHDLATGYATVISARTEAERVNLAEACIAVLGKTQYQNSNLFSLILQAMDFEKSMASKRATICRYALAMGTLPSKLLDFIKKHGGLEKCLDTARLFEDLLAGDVEVGIIVRSKEQRHVLFSFEDRSVAAKLWTQFKELPDDKKKYSRVAASRIINKIMKSFD
jgi:hypothetical protein